MARKYELKGRADAQADTRRRITEATVALHATVGPARTTISAIAERAGVQRLTVYRHFPEERELLAACGAHWIAENRDPIRRLGGDRGPSRAADRGADRDLRLGPGQRGDDRQHRARRARDAGARRGRRPRGVPRPRPRHARAAGGPRRARARPRVLHRGARWPASRGCQMKPQRR